MEYRVYQVRLTAVEVDTVNTKGHDSVARHRRNLDLTCAYNKTEDQKKAMVTEAWYEGDYDAVGKVYAKDLNEVFELGNGMGDQSKVERFGQMKSLSVGDLVEDEKQTLHLVDSCGFVAVTFAERAVAVLQNV